MKNVRVKIGFLLFLISCFIATDLNGQNNPV